MSTERTIVSSPRWLPRVPMPTSARRGWASATLDADHDRPERRPLVLDRTPTEAVKILGQTFSNQDNWEVRALGPEVGEVQLVHYTSFFRFPDDVLVRLEQRPTGGVVVHAHSQSRYGIVDFGQNARNLQELNGILRGRCVALGIDCRSLGR